MILKQKNLKHLTTLIVACFLLSSLAFMSPAKAQDNTNSWTITVEDQNGNPIQGINIFLWRTNGDLKNLYYGPSPNSDANGVIVFTAPIPPDDGGKTWVYPMGPNGWSGYTPEFNNADLQGVSETIIAYYQPPFSGTGAAIDPTPTPSPTVSPSPFSNTNLWIIAAIVTAFILVISLMIKVAFSNERKKPTKHHN